MNTSVNHLESPEGLRIPPSGLATSAADVVPVSAAIAQALASTEKGKARNAALKGVRWVLRSGSMFIGPCDPKTLETPLVQDRAAALVFDGRDNEVTRAAFFSRLFSAPFTPELL
jgi:hypothetical protein